MVSTNPKNPIPQYVLNQSMYPIYKLGLKSSVMRHMRHIGSPSWLWVSHWSWNKNQRCCSLMMVEPTWGLYRFSSIRLAWRLDVGRFKVYCCSGKTISIEWCRNSWLTSMRQIQQLMKFISSTHYRYISLRHYGSPEDPNRLVSNKSFSETLKHVGFKWKQQTNDAATGTRLITF